MKLLRIVVVAGIFVGSLQAQALGGPVATQTAASDSQSGGMKGSPFSADVVNEASRALADGTRIHQENHGRSFRDSEGRTRIESEIVRSASNGERLQNISIHDPVEHLSITLDRTIPSMARGQ